MFIEEVLGSQKAAQGTSTSSHNKDECNLPYFRAKKLMQFPK